MKGQTEAETSNVSSCSRSRVSDTQTAKGKHAELGCSKEQGTGDPDGKKPGLVQITQWIFSKSYWENAFDWQFYHGPAAERLHTFLHRRSGDFLPHALKIEPVGAHSRKVAG